MHTAITADDVGLSPLPGSDGILSFLASRSRASARTLSPSAVDVFTGCYEAVGQILSSALEARTGADFERVYQTEFPRYVLLIVAISKFAGAVVPKPLIEQLTRESICEMETDFRDKALAAFGAAVRDQALFAVWTLRKINELVTQIVAVKPEESKQKEDSEHCAQFNLSMLHAQFSLDCLNASLQTGRAIYPEVLEELVDGLRAMVNAYAWARRGLEARVPSAEMDAVIAPPDDEDRRLMDSSLAAASDFLSAE